MNINEIQHCGIYIQVIYHTSLPGRLRVSDVICREGIWSPLLQIMACCLTLLNHYLYNRCQMQHLSSGIMQLKNVFSKMAAILSMGLDYYEIPKLKSMLVKCAHLPWTKWPTFLQTTFWNAFAWMKLKEFQLKFHWNLFPGVQLTISLHWLR